MKRSIIYRLSPFNNETEMSGAEYTIKKLLAFVLIYFLSGILGEAVIIGILCGMGYDPLNGVMPAGEIGEMLFYYGFIIYSFTAIAYCRAIEKRTIKSVGFTENAADYLTGALLAVFLLFIIISVCCVLGSIEFIGINTNVNIRSVILWALAFGVQGAAEEILCRGFLLRTLQKRISVPMAIIISSTAFAIPHLPGLLESDIVYAVTGIINLYLISIIFSVLVLRRSNIWIACGLHSAWNFVLYTIMGLSLSGSEGTAKGIFLFSVNEASVLNGAEYGIEASVITAAVCGMCLLAALKIWKGRNGRDGI